MRFVFIIVLTKSQNLKKGEVHLFSFPLVFSLSLAFRAFLLDWLVLFAPNKIKKTVPRCFHDEILALFTA